MSKEREAHNGHDVGGVFEDRMRDARRAAEELARRGGPGVEETLRMWERILSDPLLAEESSPRNRPWWVESGKIVLRGDEPPVPSSTERGRAEHREGDAAEAVQPPGSGRETEPLPGVNLPVPLSRFIGRRQELEQLGVTVAQERLITVTGSSGSGKSRLVQEFFRSFAEHGEALLVDLGSVADAALVAREVGTALGLQEGGIGSFTASVQQAEVPFEERLAESLRDRHVLLVLDNVERVVDACADLVKSLLGRCRNLRVICTTRTILDLEGERIYRLPSLSLPPPEPALTEEELLDFESIRLFLDRARAKQPDLRPSAEELAVIAAICRRVDGIPYAIELAAARVDVLSLPQIHERIDQQLLHWLPGVSRARQRTMHGMIDWSYALLPSEEQALLRRLTAFRGGFTLEACEEVCAFGLLGGASILSLLSALVSKSLVETVRLDGSVRYTLLELTWWYAQAHSERAGEDRETRARHRRWCLRLAQNAAPHLMGPDQGRWMDELEVELENLRAALQPLDADGAAERLALICALGQFLIVRGHLTEGAEHLQRVLQENPTPSTLRAFGLSWSAEFALSEGRLDDARQAAQQALALSRRHRNRRAQALALRVLGAEALRRGPSERARKLLLDCRRLTEGTDQLPGHGFTDIYLGKLAEALADYGEARRCYERAERASRAAQRPWILAWSLLPLGDLDLHWNAFAAADARLEEVLELGRRINSRQLVVLGYLYLGNSAYRRDDQDVAGAHYEQAMEAMERLDEETSPALVRAAMARVAVARGDLDGARRWLRTLDWRDPLLRLPARAQILRSLGLYLCAIDEVTEAQQLQRKALGLWLRLHDHRQMLDGLERLALMTARVGGLTRAAELFAVTSATRERMELEPPPVYLDEVEALAATLEARGLEVARSPVPAVRDVVVQELQDNDQQV